MIDHIVFMVCNSYATMICIARKLTDLPDDAASLCESAHRIADAAPAEAQIYLDTVKRILEIDTQVTDPTIVLMRASLFETDTTPTTMITRKDMQHGVKIAYDDDKQRFAMTPRTTKAGNP